MGLSMMNSQADCGEEALHVDEGRKDEDHVRT